MTLEQNILQFVLILTRVSAFVAFLPMFAQRQLPMTVKAGLATALTLFWFGSLPPDSYPAYGGVIGSTLLLIKEFSIGFLLATLLGFMFIPARVAGAYIGQEVGLSLASVASPSGPDSSTLVTTIFETFAVLLFFGLNLHHFLIVFLHVSLVQLASKISLLDLPSELLVQIIAQITEWGTLIVGPVGICMFILTIGLALLNKAAPTLNLFSVGMSLRSGLGIVCMVIFMPVLLKSISFYFARYQSSLEEFLAYFD